MAEYIYLLEHRLTPPQRHALAQVRDAARDASMTVFLVGGAVRDLTTGSSVRNFDFAVQGNALELQESIAARGGELWGVDEATRTLAFFFPGSVLVTVAATRSEEYPKPGKPVYTWSPIVDDLRRRDFTANAMGLSLNEGSYGLLLDPLNGIADIEARVLRLGSNYGFLEDPSRLVRAIRLRNRLGWQMEERTQQRYENAKEADAMTALDPRLAGYELQKIASEEDALGTVKVLEEEGWMATLDAGWTSAKADLAGLEQLRKSWIQLALQGVTADLTAAHLNLLTAKMKPEEVAALKARFVSPGLVRHWEALDEQSREFAKTLTGKAASTASASWRLLTSSPGEPILWLAYTRKAGTAVDAKFKQFFTVWPEFRKKVPTALMQEMRITPELPGYAELLEQLFLEMIDGKLTTDEELKAFLEPFSPPAPPPPPTLRRSRKKNEGKGRRKAVLDDEDEEEPSAGGGSGGEDEDEEEDEEGDEVHELGSVFARLGGALSGAAEDEPLSRESGDGDEGDSPADASMEDTADAAADSSGARAAGEPERESEAPAPEPVPAAASAAPAAEVVSAPAKKTAEKKVSAESKKPAPEQVGPLAAAAAPAEVRAKAPGKPAAQTAPVPAASGSAASGPAAPGPSAGKAGAAVPAKKAPAPAKPVAAPSKPAKRAATPAPAPAAPAKQPRAAAPAPRKPAPSAAAAKKPAAPEKPAPAETRRAVAPAKSAPAPAKKAAPAPPAKAKQPPAKAGAAAARGREQAAPPARPKAAPAKAVATKAPAKKAPAKAAKKR